MWEFGIFDQAQVQDRESSHYGSWQISIESNEKLLYNSVKQNRPNINIQKVFFSETARFVSIIHIRVWLRMGVFHIFV